MIKGSFYILLFYLLGEALSILIHGLLPGSVIGMVLLFLSLYLKMINPDNVKATATAITKNMAVFFVPAAVGLMAYGEMLSSNFLAIFLAITISTVLTIVVVALVQERMEKRHPKSQPIKDDLNPQK
jgi:Putative effector of murein hydrolase LrgA